MKQKKKAYFHASCSELSRESDAEAKKADLQKLWKNIVFFFVDFLNISLSVSSLILTDCFNQFLINFKVNLGSKIGPK